MSRTSALLPLAQAAIGVAFILAANSPALAFQKAAAAPAQVATADASTAESAAAAGGDPMQLGEALYVKNCVSCHGAEGEGPARVLAGNENLKHVVLIASQMIFGGEFMPKFDLNDEEVAAIGTYIRNSWGNELGPVTAEEVAIYR